MSSGTVKAREKAIHKGIKSRQKGKPVDTVARSKKIIYTGSSTYLKHNQHTLDKPTTESWDPMSVISASKAKEKFDEMKLTPNWNHTIMEGGEHFYDYALPELGIMASGSSYKEVIADAIDSLEFKKDYYDHCTCNPQDEPEKYLVNQILILYKNNPEEFYSRLRLNEEAQSQEEVQYAGQVAL